ncbi:Conserved_hypothetical protein [Hexamita inflata]|uniref:Uncharacterized protein n=1 Tax=Hexamita inflata TaxID=28002 RepID=A0AA86TKP8_9EUKA|nr:Conserved hypothetical protein [Hexamita inflata]
MLVILTLQLNCFTDNTTIVLQKQQRSAVFTAQLLMDETKTFEVCKSMFGQYYNIQLIFGSFVYEYPSSLVMSGNLSLTFPCIDTINNCEAAFLARQVSFKIVFPETNVLLEDAVSTFKIDLYNRLDCLSDTKIIYDNAKREMQISAIAGNCKVQIKQRGNNKNQSISRFTNSKDYFSFFSNTNF